MAENIIQYTITDFDLIWRIVKSCSDWLSSNGMNHWTEFYTPERVRHKLENTEVYGYSLDKAGVVGVLSLGTHAPQYYTEAEFRRYLDPQAPAFYLSMLGVLPEFHNQGIASHLLEFSEDFVRRRDVSYLRFDALKADHSLNAFYQKRKYTIVHSEPDSEKDAMNFYEKKVF